ncbi:IS110 family transposase [Pedobacter miscanthi]|uniref:IS110 family transposase n=1 Tax=Pedobacter miscanthi TaxID=2259170 RepID=UPI00292F2990|nr:IS110 family transposase [Pedobacter miscanthi]
MSKVSKIKKKRASSSREGLKMERFGLLYPRSAGIDVGSMLMVVSYTDRNDMINVREFNSFTESLMELSELLQREGVEQVVMEATGEYWKTLYCMLETHGMQVLMANPSHYRNVSAQKTDINDAQWLHQLLAHGLIRSSHIATELYRQLRRYVHERKTCQDLKSDTLNRIQKTLTLMNIKFQHLISDIEGVAGMKILRAIVSGVSEPEALLKLVDLNRLKASPEDLISSLKGDYQEHHIHILASMMKAYDFHKSQMLEYETYIESTLQKLVPVSGPGGDLQVIGKKKVKARKNEYHFNLTDYLESIFGVDLTAVDGLDEIGLLAILAVTGTDMKKWPTASHFASWLNLSPRPKISGGKKIGNEKRSTNNPATQAFRLAANSLWQNKGPIGQQYRKLAATKGSAKAIKAIARKLATVFYNMVLKKEAFDPKKIQQNVEIREAKRIARLLKDAANMGYAIQKVA